MLTGMLVGYAYGMEFFIAWYGQNPNEIFVFINRAMGPFAWSYWIMVSCNVLFPQIFWFKWARTNFWVTLVIVLLVNVGMWFERFVIIVTSLHRDYLPSSWGYYRATWVDYGLLIGSFGLFFTLTFLFVRVLPAISIAELKAVTKHSQPGHHHSEGAH